MRGVRAILTYPNTAGIVVVLAVALVAQVVVAVRTPMVGHWLVVGIVAFVLAAALAWLVVLIRQGRAPARGDSGNGGG